MTPDKIAPEPSCGACESIEPACPGVTSALTNDRPANESNSIPGPPPHIFAAGRYAASFADRDPIDVRVADFPPEWRAVFQHGASTDEERERFRQHRMALAIFLQILVQGECRKIGLGVQGIAPVEPCGGLDVAQAEIEVLAACLWLDDTTRATGRFPAALAMWLAVQVMRWIRLAQAQQSQQGPRLLTPRDPGFSAERGKLNREQRRAQKRGRP